MGAVIQIMRRVVGAVNAHGNPVDAFTDPEDLPVLAVAPASRDEPTDTGRPYATVSGWTVYAPLGTVVSPYDRVVLPAWVVPPDGAECQIVGEVAVWDRNPHAARFRGGVVFDVERRQG